MPESQSRAENWRVSRISECFERLAAAGQAAFVAYVTAGDPSAEATLEVAGALESAGVDILELGIPFSDPLADGPTIQAASNRALAAGMTVARVLQLVRQIRERSEMPLVLFTYLNPVYVFGFERCLAEAADAGADGLLLLDLPPDEAACNRELAASGRLDLIRLIAPTTPADRMESIVRTAAGFLYAVSREGVTGERRELAEGLGRQVAEIRRHSSLPVVVGFGISSPSQAAAVATEADGVVVGSAIVRQIAEQAAAPDLPARVADFVRPLIQAVRSVSKN